MIGACAPSRSSPPPAPPTWPSARSTNPYRASTTCSSTCTRSGSRSRTCCSARGMYQLRPEPPFTLGIDVAGTVVSGPGFEPGQRVAGASPTEARRARGRPGGPGRSRSPTRSPSSRAAALPMNYLTAHFALVERGGLRAGETVLVNGAAGGVGTASIQVAAGFGARGGRRDVDRGEGGVRPGGRAPTTRSSSRASRTRSCALTEGPRRRPRRRRRGRRRLPRLTAQPGRPGPVCWWSGSPPARGSRRSR